MKHVIICLVLFSSSFALAFDHQHKDWTAFLKKTVHMEETKSTVDYDKALKLKKDLLSYNKSLSAVQKDDFESWTKNQQLAFLVNAYNSFTIQQIVDHYPVDSIKSKKISWFSPFKQKFFKLFGEEISTSHLEHEMIRKWYNEPRIHFAIVCASVGCPALQDEAFTADNSERLFERGAEIFLNDSSRNRFDSKTNTLKISKIFKWFKDDFGGSDASVAKFISKYMKLPEADKTKLKSGKVDIDYLDYNWKLNKK